MKRQLSWIGIDALVVSVFGCPFKQHRPPVPQQGLAPPVQPDPVHPPAVQAPAEAQPVPPPPDTPPEKAEEKAPKKKPSPKKPATPTTANQQANQPAAPAPNQGPAMTSKLVIQEGNSPNSQGTLSAGVGVTDSSRAKQTTE